MIRHHRFKIEETEIRERFNRRKSWKMRYKRTRRNNQECIISFIMPKINLKDTSYPFIKTNKSHLSININPTYVLR